MSATASLSEMELDRYIDQVRSDWGNVGVAVAVVRGSQVVYACGFGVREVGKPAQIDQHTLFQVGSTTKAFTTAALGILVDEGKLHWDDAIVDYLPGFRLQDPWITRNLTIRDAVTHRSGISVSYYPFLAVMDSDASIRQLRYLASAAAFRDTFIYDNLMYAVAGKVIEAASGVTWNDFVRRRLLQPLGMERSGTSPYEFWDAKYVAHTFLGSADAGPASLDNARDSNIAMPHSPDESGSIVVLPWQSYDNAAAAGSIVSSVADMAKWLALHLNEGRVEGGAILRKETLQELHASQNLHAGFNEFLFGETSEGYALGWWRARYRGHTHLEHGGGIMGFPSYAALMPDLKLGVVVLSNSPKVVYRDHALGYLFHKSIAYWVFDRALGQARRDWSRNLLGRTQMAQCEALEKEAALRQARLADRPHALPLDRYAGEYEDEMRPSGRLRVYIANDGLALGFSGQGAYHGTLEHWHHDLFRLRSGTGVAEVLGPQFVAFIVDPFGRVTSMSAFGAQWRRL